MPIGRWGYGWFRARFATGNGPARGAILVLGVLCALFYLVSALWFDVAYWVLGRFAADRIGRRVRAGVSIAFAILVIAALSVSGGKPAAEPTRSPAAVAAATPGPASQSPQVEPTSAPTSTPSIDVVAASPTPADIDDEAGPNLAPGASFTPELTGVALVPVAPGSPADRLPGEPDPALTPGALNPAVTQATIDSTICVSGWTATIRPPSDYTSALKVQQITEYSYSDISTADYEEDHLIPLELGGSPTDARNLWPEPYTADLADGRPTGAHTKDGFETKLKIEVCAGTITLTKAQAEIGDDWVHAYYGIATSSGSPAAGQSATAVTSAAPSASPVGTPSSSATGTPAASLSVNITSLPASINHGANATLVAVTSPGATCSASVTYASGTVSGAAGLQTHPVAGSSGSVSWTWKVGTSTKPGTSTATVTCSLGGNTATDGRDFQVT